jgi:hypothetical protein
MIPAAYILETSSGLLVAAVFGLAGSVVQILGTVENVSFVNYLHTNPNGPFDTSLFVPGSSAVPTHLQDLLHNRNVDLWLVYVWDQFGTGVLLLPLLAFALLLVAGVALLLASGGQVPTYVAAEPTPAATPD